MGFFKWLNKQKAKTEKYNNVFKRHRIKLNVKKDPVDERDFLISKISPLKAEELPTSFSLQSYCTVIKNQGNLGACTGFSITGAFEIFRKRDWNEELDTSELFSYYNARAIEGTVNQDAGAYIRDICDSGMKDGICLEQFCPYVPQNFAKKPSWTAYFVARFFRLKGYYRCYNVQEVKQALYHGLPVLFGFSVYSNFFDYKGGIYKEAFGNLAGGHAVCAIAYDDSKNAFLVRNSWGNAWGESGYFWIDYSVWSKLLLDAWALQYTPPNNVVKTALKLLV